MGRVAVFVLATSLSSAVWAQNLRYDNHREVAVPEYATIQLGPFHSSWAISLSTGYRYVETSGTGTDYIFTGSRGRLKEDGGDIPIILGLDTRNYLVIGPHTDLDLSVSFRYEYYTMDTQESEFRIHLPGEGINATLSMEMAPTPYFRMRLWDAFGWRTDYIDTRGMDDNYGGERFEYIRNTVGLDGDLLLVERQNLGFGIARADRWALDDGWEDQAYVTHSGYLLYEYQLAEYVTTGLRGGLTHIDYTDSDRPSSLISEYQAELGTRLTERSTVNVFAGYAFGTISGSSNSMEEVDTSIYGVALQTELSPRLKHALTYAHGLQGGYESSLEEFDLFRYDIRWTGDFARWGAYTGIQTRDPSSPTVNGYDDWTSGLTGTVPVLPYLSMVGAARYGVRNNDDTTIVGLAPEDRSDYDTWSIRAGPVLRLADEWSLAAFAEHIERDGDDDELDYTRDILSIMLTYRHEL
jgi:hypothetical protein